MSAYPCPQCGEHTGVCFTRLDLRKRKCKACAHTFFTQEIEFEPNGKSPLTLKRLLTKDARFEP